MEAVLKRSDNDIVACKAKVIRRAVSSPSDAELEQRFADLAMPEFPQDDYTSEEIIKSNSGKTIKPIEKWL